MNAENEKPQVDEIYQIMTDLYDVPVEDYEKENVAIAHLALSCLIAHENGIERHNFLDAAVTLFDELEV